MKIHHRVIYRHSHTDKSSSILAIQYVMVMLSLYSTVTHPVLAASPLCLGWKMCVWGHCHHPLGSWKAHFWCSHTDSTIKEVNHDYRAGLTQGHSGKREFKAIQTLRRSSGKSPPSLIPLFMEMNRSTVGLSLTFGLWRLVFSMIMAKERM